METSVKNRLVYASMAALFLFSVFFLALRPIGDFDTGYHLMTGEYVISHKSVPLYDVFSYTASGSRWVAHYWLGDAIFYALFSSFGIWGLIIFVALLAAVTYGIVLATLWRARGPSAVSLVLLFLFSYLTLELWVVRPQIYTYVLAALLVYILEAWRIKKRQPLLWWMLPIFLFWANAHAGVVLGIVIFALYIADFFIKHWEQKKSWIFPGAIFILSCALTLINPNGYSVLIYSSIIAPAVAAMKVMEWKSIIYSLTRWQAWAFLGLMAVSFLLVWWRELRKKLSFREINWVSLGLITGACALPLISVRHVGIFPILALPLVGAAVQDIFVSARVRIEEMFSVKLLVVALGVILVAGPLLRVEKMHLLNDQQLPVDAVQFIKTEHLPGPIFNEQSFGGYLIWQLWPEYKVFMDGRSEVFMGTADRDYDAILYHKPGWESIMNDTYGINTVILSYPDIGNAFGAEALEPYLKAGFVLVYFDDTSVVLVRSLPSTAQLISHYGYRTLDPFKNPFSIPDSRISAAYREAQRAYGQSPDSVTAKFFVTAFGMRLEKSTSSPQTP